VRTRERRISGYKKKILNEIILNLEKKNKKQKLNKKIKNEI
jgi:hypothetical protein